MSTIDLRDRTIHDLGDLLDVHRQAFAQTGLEQHDVFVTQEQRETIYGLLQAQTPWEPLPSDGPVRWCGMTITAV